LKITVGEFKNLCGLNGVFLNITYAIDLHLAENTGIIP
jgi:hypothetical protein